MNNQRVFVFNPLYWQIVARYSFLLVIHVLYMHVRVSMPLTILWLDRKRVT